MRRWLVVAALLAGVAVNARDSVSDAQIATPGAREIQPGVYLLNRRFEFERGLPTFTVGAAGQALTGDPSEWATRTRCNPRRQGSAAGECLWSFASGRLTRVEAPARATWEQPQTLNTPDGQVLSAWRNSSSDVALPDGDRVETVFLEDDVQSRLRLPWNGQPLRLLAQFQPGIYYACHCIVGLRRVSAQGEVRWANAYFWHPHADGIELTRPPSSIPFPDPLLALNQYSFPRGAKVVLAQAQAELSVDSMVLGISLDSGLPLSAPRGFAVVAWERLAQFYVAHVEKDLASEARKKNPADRSVDYFVDSEDAEAWLLASFPALRETWEP